MTFAFFILFLLLNEDMQLLGSEDEVKSVIFKSPMLIHKEISNTSVDVCAIEIIEVL